MPNITRVQQRINAMRAAQQYEANRAKRDAATPRITCLFICIEAFCRTMIEAYAVQAGEYDSYTTKSNHDRMTAYLGGCDLPH